MAEKLSALSASLVERSALLSDRLLGAAWENDAGEEVEQLIDALTCAASTAQKATQKLCASPISAEFKALHDRIDATRFYD